MSNKSWYVEFLLSNYYDIKSSVIQDSYTDISVGIDSGFIDDVLHMDVNLDSSLYDDLLSVEMEINRQRSLNCVTDKELELVEMIKENRPNFEIEEKLLVSRATVYNMFSKLCSKIAFALGEHFSNDGFVEDLALKYSLEDEEIEDIMERID